jgi:predicted regulator of Ras-like GTPase activity (Roadblock/LC7/MglB family)
MIASIKNLLQNFIGVSGKDSQLETIPSTSGESSNNIVANGVQTMAINLSELSDIDGFLGACLVDSDSGMVLGMSGGTMINLDVAAAGNTEVVKAKRKTMKALALKDAIEDILITLGKQYHLIRPLESNDALFIYLALNRTNANLGMARMQLKSFEKKVALA